MEASRASMALAAAARGEARCGRCDKGEAALAFRATRHLFLTHLYEKAEISLSIDSTILGGDSHIVETAIKHFPSFVECVGERM
jgi:hypothetical protein